MNVVLFNEFGTPKIKEEAVPELNLRVERLKSQYIISPY